MVRKIVSSYRRDPLAAENIFLRRLFSTSLPRRLKRFYRLSNLAQAGIILINLSLLSAGYLLGRWKYR